MRSLLNFITMIVTQLGRIPYGQRFSMLAALALALCLALPRLGEPAAKKESAVPDWDLGREVLEDTAAISAREAYIRERTLVLEEADSVEELSRRLEQALDEAPDSLAWPALFAKAGGHRLLAPPVNPDPTDIDSAIEYLFGRKSKSQEGLAPSFARLCSQAARKSQSLAKRELYARFFNYEWIGNKEGPNVEIMRQEWLPGDYLAYVWPRHFGHASISKGKQPTLKVEIARVELGSDFYPERVEVLDTVDFQEVSGKASSNIKKHLQGPSLHQPGLYRLAILHPSFYQEDMVRISRLHLALRQDGPEVLIWGASLGNHVPGPYRVYLEKADGGWLRFNTDADGKLEGRLSGWPAGKKSLRVVLDAPGEAPAFGVLQKPEPRIPRPFVWSDRPSYQEGEMLRLKGLLHGADSVRLSLYGPEKQRLWGQVLPVDAFGQFGDSLLLEKGLAVSPYMRAEVDSAFKKGAWQPCAPVLDGLIKFKDKQEPAPSLRLMPLNGYALQGDSICIPIRGLDADQTPLKDARVGVRWLRSRLYWRNGLRASRRWRYLMHEDTLQLDAWGQGEARARLKWLDSADQELLVEAYLIEKEEQDLSETDLLDTGELDLSETDLLDTGELDLSEMGLLEDLQSLLKLKSQRTKRVLSRVALRAPQGGAYMEIWAKGEATGALQVKGHALDLQERPLEGPLKLEFLREGRLVRSVKVRTSPDGSFRHTAYHLPPGAYTLKLETQTPLGALSRQIQADLSPGTLGLFNGMPQVLGESDSLNLEAQGPVSLWQLGGALPGQLSTRILGSADSKVALPFVPAQIHALYVDSSGMKGIYRYMGTDNRAGLLRASLQWKQELHAGERTLFEVKLTDWEGHPVQGAFSAALYDASAELNASNEAISYSSEIPDWQYLWPFAQAQTYPYAEPFPFEPSSLYRWKGFKASPEDSGNPRQYEPNPNRPVILPYVMPREEGSVYENADSDWGMLWSEPYNEEFRGSSRDLGLQAWIGSQSTSGLGGTSFVWTMPSTPGSYVLRLVGSDRLGRLVDRTYNIWVLP